MATSKGGIFYFPSFDTKSYSLKKPIETIFPSDTGLFLSNREYEYIYNYNDQKLISTRSDFCYSDLSHRKYNFSFFGHIGMDLKYSNLRSHLTDVTSISGIHIMSDSLLYLWNLGQLFKVKHNEIDYDFFWEFSDNYKWKDVIDKKFYMETVYCLKEDSCLIGLKNGMYLFSRDSIINLHKEEGKRIRRIEYFKKSNVLAYCIWGEGLVLEFNNGKQLRLSEKDGLASNTINTTFMDDNEVLWLGTNKGINSLQVDTLTDEYHISTISNGSKNLSSPNVLQIYNRDSNLYLGTDSGFDIIDLRVDGKMAEIPLVLDSLYINESYYKPTNDFISLRYDSNTFTFYYTAIAFNKFGDLKYRYKLEGLSNNWVYTKERKTTFIQLNPGEYTFHLQVQNEQGKWINLGLKPHFNIKPPYWTTWWFIGGGVLLSLLLIGGILFYYIRNIRKEKTFIEQEKHLLEELNESQQKALSSQLNPHFVFNSLNSMQNFILTKRTELSSDYLSKFSKLMRFVFENSKKLYVPLSDEIEALELYLELEEVRHNHKFSYQIKDNILETEEIQIPALLVQPIIENAIWHGLLHKKSEDRLLEIKFYVDDMSLHIDVKDNGVGRGFSKPRPKFIKKQRSSGVQLTKQRLELLSQSSNLDTNFKIIDLSDKIGRPCGTCVTISIPLTLNSIDK